MIALAIATPAGADAQDSPYCRRVRAEAESRAFLMFSPRLAVQGLHVPLVGGTTGTGIVQGQEWQARAALSFSPMDMIRGAYVLDQASADCDRRIVGEEIQRALSIGTSYGRSHSLRAQLSYLQSQQPAIEQLLADAQAARDEQLITMHQLNDVRLRANAIARRMQSLEAEIERLDEDDADRGATERPLRAQLDDYEGRSIDLARAQSDLRRLNPWQINVSAGIVPLSTFDWFGAVELSYNLGGIAQQFAEDRAVEARADEIREASYEVRHEVERFEERMRTSTRDLRDALRLLDAQAELMDEQRDLLTRTSEETAEAQHSLRMVEMNRIELESDRVYRRTLLAEREAISGGDDDER
ncbi:MAG: hypothetical protein H6719_17165 [Sandaracinaceae bacterium]|nr:hypothetical protein [Sandaracinaceae bacterium]